MSDTQVTSNQFQTSAIKGLLILAGGFALFFAVFIPRFSIIAVMNTDLLTALFLLFEHGILDVCYVLAAFFFLSAILLRRATLADIGLARFPFLERTPTRGLLGQLGSGALFLLATLALVLLGEVILVFVQGQWLLLLQNAFHMITPFDDWGLPALWKQKPLSCGVEIFVLCGLAPFAEEVLFRGMLFQWLAGRFGLWIGVLFSAFIFSIMHWNLPGFANFFLLGIFSALLFRTSRSLWPSIVMHSLWNALFVLAAFGVLH